MMEKTYLSENDYFSKIFEHTLCPESPFHEILNIFAVFNLQSKYRDNIVF